MKLRSPIEVKCQLPSNEGSRNFVAAFLRSNCNAIAEFSFKTDKLVSQVQLCAGNIKMIGKARHAWIGSSKVRRVLLVQSRRLFFLRQWRSFLMDFEVASRGHAAGLRPVLLVVVRGVPRKRLQAPGAALALRLWHGVFGELDTLIYVDQRLRVLQKRARHHKLLVRQIAALALWDLDLADFLLAQPEQDLFEPNTVLQAGRDALHSQDSPIGAEWERGGVDQFDGVEMVHSFVLLGQGDQKLELVRRLWSAQAAELLPLIELRRRELAKGLERHVKCPFWLGGDRQVRSLDELEIGPLAHVARTNSVDPALRDRADRLAEYRNTLAHLKLLGCGEALDSRLHA